MATPAKPDAGIQEGVERPKNRIWLLQYGPCWCRSHPTDSSSFDYVRVRRSDADLGTWNRNLLVVSDRVIDGSSHLYRQVYSDLPDPKVIIAAAPCPAAGQFWAELPNGWGPVEEVIPIDIHVDDCISGSPESLMAAVLTHALARDEALQHDEERSVSLSG